MGHEVTQSVASLPVVGLDKAVFGSPPVPPVVLVWAKFRCKGKGLWMSECVHNLGRKSEWSLDSGVANTF